MFALSISISDIKHLFMQAAHAHGASRQRSAWPRDFVNDKDSD